MKIDEAISPSEVLASVAAALPESARANVIVVGGLAAGYYFFAGDGARAIRTEDVDCLFSPWARAVAAAEDVTEQLLEAHWTLRENRAFGAPGVGNRSAGSFAAGPTAAAWRRYEPLVPGTALGAAKL
ncbi:hypothetical protein ACG02S_17050 [Roseateles sp. DC23W]|uniref:Nucleotidyltransferase n=1 Tax=Pelomonas dachongensis TaxID=3299029 RepID=A0ABW7EQ34_9BURK